MVIITSTILI